MNRSIPALLYAILLTLIVPTAMALDDGWPRTLSVGDGLVTIYPLQVEDLEGNKLRYRAALAWRPTADADPIFGAGWFESQVVIDQGNRLVRPQDLRIVDTRFPEGTAELQARLASALAEQAPGWNLDISLDELNEGLSIAEAEKESLQKLNTAPPRIVYRDHPAILLTLDGNPVLRAIEDSPYQAVINTPYPLISDGRHYYLNAAREVWYRADEPTGPYRYLADPPADIAAMVKPQDSTEVAVETAAEPVTSANAPEVVVATEPTELIVTDGPAVFVPLVDDLLVLKNSEDDVFMHVSTQQFYIVLAGRWYRADTLAGPWDYRAANRLPPAFANIPPDSSQADSRVFVAGTPEAQEAAKDAQIPETKAVARGPAEVEVAYDGEPEFAPVDGTDLAYAANTGATVLQSDRRYYLVEDGVWYESATPDGPWEVATQRPAGVEAIAPSSPVYNTKYVYIYGSTPSVVYVGYTPGYLGSYVYYDTVVYGTGWHYRPWVSPRYYYPRPSTWGFHVSYNPWYGWNFGLSWNWGWGWGPFYAGFYSGGYWHHGHSWHHPYRGYYRPRGHRSRHARYSGHHYSRDRYGHDGYRGNRGGSARNNRIHEDARNRDRASRAFSVDARDSRYARGSKERRHRTGPVHASDLRLKARARDANAAAARNVLVADSRGDVQPRMVRNTDRRALAAADMTPGKVARNRTTPVRVSRAENRTPEPRQNREARAPQRSGTGVATVPRRNTAAAPTRARQPSDRRTARSRERGSPPIAANPSAREAMARRDQVRRAPAPSAAGRDRAPQSTGPRNAMPRSRSAAPTRQPPAQRAAPGRRDVRSAAPAPRQRAAHQDAGRRAGGSHGGPRQTRRDRTRLE